MFTDSNWVWHSVNQTLFGLLITSWDTHWSSIVYSICCTDTSFTSIHASRKIAPSVHITVLPVFTPASICININMSKHYVSKELAFTPQAPISSLRDINPSVICSQYISINSLARSPLLMCITPQWQCPLLDTYVTTSQSPVISPCALSPQCSQPLSTQYTYLIG